MSHSQLPALPAALEERLADLRPRKARNPKRQFTIFLVGAAAYIAAVTVGTKLRADWVELPHWWQWGSAALWAIGLIVPAWLLLFPRKGQVAGSWRAAAFVAAASAIVFVGLGFIVHPSGPSSFSFADDPLRLHC
jgi:phosphoglycerol transferase MdoB-like AlkP superfamily enzyme